MKQTYEHTLEKGERFFARKNFPLAKKAFEAAAHIKINATLQEKIQICTKQIKIEENKEAVKRGRKLEKKGRFQQALQCFEQAYIDVQEEWLEKKIADLHANIVQTEASSLVEKVQENDDPQATIMACDQALALNWNPALVEKKAGCLVALGDYLQAASLYDQHQPDNDLARHHYGVALAETGRYTQAVEQWSAIKIKDMPLVQRVEALLPTLYDKTGENGYAEVYAFIHSLPDAYKSDELQNSEHYCKFKLIEALWYQEAYSNILSILEPQPKHLTLPLLGLYAKLYLKLAETDNQYLELAISYGLTAIYNDNLLQSLHVFTLSSAGLEIKAVREKLLQNLEALIDHYDREEQLPQNTRAHWKLESRIIQQLPVPPPSNPTPEFYPCTPSFATKWNLSSQVLSCLQRKDTIPDNIIELDTQAYFSPSGQALFYMERGEGELALSALPTKNIDKLSSFCRQRIFLAYGIQLAYKGESRLRKYFSEALPLLKEHPQYVEDIIKLAYTGKEETALIGLADTMEFLSTHIKTPKFLATVAHAMGNKATIMLAQKVNPRLVEKLLRKADTICPDSAIVKEILVEAKWCIDADDMGKAFKRQHSIKAAQIALRSGDHEHRVYFFETIEQWFSEVLTWNQPEKLASITELLQSCRLLDAEHPVTKMIEEHQQHLEDE